MRASSVKAALISSVPVDAGQTTDPLFNLYRNEAGSLKDVSAWEEPYRTIWNRNSTAWTTIYAN